MQNTNTRHYGGKILKILQHLSTAYCHITPQQPLSYAVDPIFTPIDDLLELSEYALMPMSSSQALNLRYVICVKNPILLKNLRVWN